MASDTPVSVSTDTQVQIPSQTTVVSGDGITAPQQYILQNISLITADGTAFDLTTVMIELNIHEDIFSPAISGSLIIVDANGIIENYQMSGFNFISINFSKTGVDDPQTINKIFRIYKIGERQQQTRSRETFPIYFCSEELLLNEQIKIAAAFPNTPIDQIVLSVLGSGTDSQIPNLGIDNSKIGTIEQTQGLYNFIIPNLKPFEAINWLATYAQPVSEQNTSADMLFFENNEGFNFRSLQSMMNNLNGTAEGNWPDSQSVYASYNYSPQNLSITSQNLNYQINAILAYRFITLFDAMNIINGGGYANKLISIDPLLRTSKSTVFNYDDNFSTSTSLNEYSISNGYKNRFGQTVSQTSEAVFKVAVGNADDLQTSITGFSSEPNYGNPILAALNKAGDLSSVTYDIGIEKYVPYRTAQLSVINHTKVEFTVPGDPGLTVGVPVTLNLPSYAISQDDKYSPKVDKYYAANYLVTAVRHLLKIDGTYTCVVEAVTDSVASPFAQSADLSEVNSQ
jgi:hypothetical protein